MLLIYVHFILILPKSKTNEIQSHASKFWFKEIIWSYFVCFSGKIKENSRRVKEKVRNREKKERMLLPSLKTKALSLKPRPQPPFSLKRVDSRLSESSCSGELPLPPFLPKRVQRPPFSPKRDPFFSLKYSCSPKRDLGFSTSRPSERLSLGWRMLSRSSET